MLGPSISHPVKLILRRCVFTHVVEYMCIRDFLENADVSA